jgi:thiosulfate reductase cytochrome b subunit
MSTRSLEEGAAGYRYTSRPSLRHGVAHRWRKSALGWRQALHAQRPQGPAVLDHDVRAALTFKLGHADLTVYNYVQRVLYAGIILVGVIIVLSGLGMWKPVQLHWLVSLFGDYPTARYIHFFCMAAICAFLVIHVLLALLVPKSLRAMIIGR